jgi:hypothetical protein
VDVKEKCARQIFLLAISVRKFYIRGKEIASIFKVWPETTMDIEEIRKHLLRRPFRPILIHMDNGRTHLITHPEIIVTEMVVVAVDEDGDAVYLAPEAISKITYPKKRTATRRARVTRTRTRKAS